MYLLEIASVIVAAHAADDSLRLRSTLTDICFSPRYLADEDRGADDHRMQVDAWFLLGAPWDSSGSGRGEQAAPEALRAAGLTRLVSRDLGDAQTSITSTDRDERSGVRALPDTVRASTELAARLSSALPALPGRRPLVVGGDCSILLGIFPALRARGPAALWFLDGHPDFLDGASSDTGETADMELAVLTGWGAPSLVELGGFVPLVAADRVVLLGHRTDGVDAGGAAENARLPPQLRRIDATGLLADPTAAGRRATGWLTATADHDSPAYGCTSTSMSSTPRHCPR